MNEEYNLSDTLNLPVVKSAGGLVYNDNHHILLIFKRGRWDLPKGRFNGEDNPAETALREIAEETGLDIDKLTINGKLVSTWHTTKYQKTKYLKKTHWYLVHYHGKDSDVSPQIEEGIIECRWVHLPDLDKYRDPMLPRIEYVVDFWLQNLAYAPRF